MENNGEPNHVIWNEELLKAKDELFRLNQMCETDPGLFEVELKFNKVIAKIDHQIRHMPDQWETSSSALAEISDWLLQAFMKTDETLLLDATLKCMCMLLEFAPKNDTRVTGWLNFTGNLNWLKFVALGNLDDLSTAVELNKRVIELTPEGDIDLPLNFHTLGDLQGRLFEASGNPADLQEAIDNLSRAVTLTPSDHHTFPNRLNSLASAYRTRFLKLGDTRDIDRSIEHLSYAVSLGPVEYSDFPELLVSLSVSYGARFKKLGRLNDLEGALEQLKCAVDLTLEDDPDLPERLANLGTLYGTKCDKTGSLDDINMAVEYTTSAVALVQKGHPNLALCLQALAVSLEKRFNYLGNKHDIDNSIEYTTRALTITSDDDSYLLVLLNTLGSLYTSRFHVSDDLDDIEKSIHHLTRAVALTSKDDPELAPRVNSLSLSYHARFIRLGQLSDIDKAIEYQTSAAALAPEGPDLFQILNNLGNSYEARSKRLGHPEDINMAVKVLSRAVMLAPEDHPELPARLSNLGVVYETRFHILGDLDDIEKSIRYLTRAVELTPKSHPDLLAWLNNLGMSHEDRFRSFGNENDINKAIEYLTQAVTFTPEGHPDLATRLNTLGVLYSARSEIFDTTDDIEKEVLHISRAVELTPEGHSHLPTRLKNLGESHYRQFEHLKQENSLNNALECFSRSSRCLHGDPLIKIRAARQWGHLSTKFNLSDPIQAYQTALALLPQLVWMGARISRRYEEIKSMSDLAAEAACAAIDSQKYSLALEWLEQARSIVWNQTLQLRTPVDGLQAAHPKLASRIQNIASQLFTANSKPEAPTNDTLDSEQSSQKPRRLAEEYDDLLSEIRQLKGFETFLKPKRASELLHAAKNGPVVAINCYQHRCDALVIVPGSGSISHVPLRSFNIEKAKNARIPIENALRTCGTRECSQSRRPLGPDDEDDFESVLANLWKDVAKPLLEHLGYTKNGATENLPHITWCLTGPLSFLPIHAAGIYDQPRSKLSDFVVSSYTPTVTALLSQLARPNIQHSSILAIGQESTPGLGHLPGTTHELAEIARHSSKNIKYTQLVDKGATVKAVMDAMEKHDWVHLACHAHQSIADPSTSGFFLSDGTLELSAIRNQAFTGKGLAFLSACQTATGAKELPDEVVHLASGMLMAGYPSVIGTMWSVMDSDAPLVAGSVYSRLLENGSMDFRGAARALHQATAALRKEVGYRAFTRWVPFVHFGI